MTQDEFTTKFNNLFNNDGTYDLSSAATLRAEVEADYQSAADNATLLTTAQSEITTLKDQNKQLHDTNLRLFMSLPNTSGGTLHSDNEDDLSDTHTDEPPTFPTCNEISEMLMGKTK